MAKATAVIQPNYGLYFDRPEVNLSPKMLADGKNFRLKNGVINANNLGWARFSTAWQLDGPVMLIVSFVPRNDVEHLVFVTLKSVYVYDAGTDDALKLNQTYATGTVAVSGTGVTGTGTLWLANVKAGDTITFGTAVGTSAKLTWYTVDSVTDNTHLVLTTSAGTIGAGSTYTVSIAFQGDKRDQWDWDIFTQDGTSGDDLLFLTNGVDDVLTWNGTDATVTPHPELGFTCTSLTTFSNMMIYGKLVEGVDNLPTSIINSDIGLPLNAGSTGTGVSNEFITHDGSDKIVVMLPLADNLVIYSERTLTVVQFIGDPLIFAFRQAAHGYGAVGRAALADFGDHHEFVNIDAQYGFDGVGLKEINSHVFREAIRRGDPNRRTFTFSHFDEQNGDLIWAIPSTNDPATTQTTDNRQGATAFVEHYLEDVPQAVETPFSFRQFPFTASGYYQRKTGLTWAQVLASWSEYNYSWNDQFFALAFPQNLMGDDDGKIYIISESQTGDGVALPSFVRFGRVALGTGRERGLLRRIYPFVETTATQLTVTVWMADHASGQLTLAGTYTYDGTHPEGGHFVSVFRRGRFTSMQFGDPGGAGWVLDGLDYDQSAGGKR
jgi:hypothetical protein